MLIRCCCWTKISAYGLISLDLFPFVMSWKFVLVSASNLANNFKNLFTFCVNFDIDEFLLLDKNKDL